MMMGDGGAGDDEPEMGAYLMVISVGDKTYFYFPSLIRQRNKSGRIFSSSRQMTTNRGAY